MIVKPTKAPWVAVLTAAIGFVPVTLMALYMYTYNLSGASYRGKYSKEWEAALSAPDSTTHHAAIEELVRGGERAKAVLIDLLENSASSAVRADAAHCMGMLDYLSEDTESALARAVNDNDSVVRLHVHRALAKHARTRTDLLRFLFIGVDDKSFTVRCSIAASLKGFWNADPRTRMALEKLTHDPIEVVRIDSAAILLEMDFYLYEQLSAVLFEGAQSNSAAIQVTSLEALGRLAQYFPEAPGCVYQACESEKPGVRIAAAVALWKVCRTPSAVELVITELYNAKPGVKLAAIEAIAEIGPVADTAQPSLRNLSCDSNPQIRNAASRALIKIAKRKECMPQ